MLVSSGSLFIFKTVALHGLLREPQSSGPHSGGRKGHVPSLLFFLKKNKNLPKSSLQLLPKGSLARISHVGTLASREAGNMNLPACFGDSTKEPTMSSTDPIKHPFHTFSPLIYFKVGNSQRAVTDN